MCLCRLWHELVAVQNKEETDIIRKVSVVDEDVSVAVMSDKERCV